MKPLYYRSVSSKGAGRPRLTHHHKGWWNETKWMRRVWRNGGMKFVVGENGRNPREKPTQTPFRPPRTLYGGTETRTRDPSGGRRAPNRLRHEAAINNLSVTNFETQLLVFCLFWFPNWLFGPLEINFSYTVLLSECPNSFVSGIIGSLNIRGQSLRETATLLGNRRCTLVWRQSRKEIHF